MALDCHGRPALHASAHPIAASPPQVPSLIGTMLTLRHLLLYSNQLVDLPTSLCLITGLEVLDVHKNMITVLPLDMGKLTALKKLDISENKIIELPISFCELSDEITLSCGRNPLEKPGIEQARQLEDVDCH